MNLLDTLNIRTLFRGSTGLSSTNHSALASHVDMCNYEGVILLASVVESSAGGTTGGFEIVPYHSSSTASTSFTALGSTCIGGVTATLTTGNWGDFVAVDIHLPTKRYISAQIHKDGANTVMASPLFAIQYGPKVAKVTQSTAYCIEAVNCNSPTT